LRSWNFEDKPVAKLELGRSAKAREGEEKVGLPIDGPSFHRARLIFRREDRHAGNGEAGLEALRYGKPEALRYGCAAAWRGWREKESALQGWLCSRLASPRGGGEGANRMKTNSMAAKAKRPRGPRRKTEAMPSLRISSRVPAPLAERMQRAADWRGLSLAAFIVESARKCAEEVIEHEERWEMTAAEAKTVAAMLAKPPAPKAALRKAIMLAGDVEVRS